MQPLWVAMIISDTSVEMTFRVKLVLESWRDRQTDKQVTLSHSCYYAGSKPGEFEPRALHLVDYGMGW